MSRFEYCLYSRFPIDYVLKELQTIVTGICQDIVPKVFRQLDMCVPSDSDPTFLPYTPSRMPMCVSDLLRPAKGAMAQQSERRTVNQNDQQHMCPATLILLTDFRG